MKRSWLQISPRGTARERYEQRVGLAPLASAAAAETSADSDAAAASEAERDAGERERLASFFRNVAAGAHAHDLGDESLYLAEELAELQWSLAGRHKRAVALLALATMISARQGSSRLPIDLAPDGYLARLLGSLLSAGEMQLAPAEVLRDIEALPRLPALDKVIGRPGEYRPLIFSDGCIYQHRMLWCEDQLAARLRERLGGARDDTSMAGRAAPRTTAGTAAGAAGDSAGAVAGDAASEDAASAALAAVLARPAMVGADAVVLSDEQAAAVRAATRQRFCVISGGPGTGKTAIVVTILRTLARLGESPESALLAAPTGKAANRMGSSIRSALLAVPDPDPVDRQLLERASEPQTLHRLLGYVPVLDRFRQHENNPLRARTVIVDEASMIDAELMERLLRAVPSETRLVLLGDADQLPSVDAGAVLRDLVAAGTGDDGGFARRLTHSYRMDVRDPAGRAILGAAQAMNRGETALALPIRRAAKELQWHGIELLDTVGATGATEGTTAPAADIAAVNDFVDHWYDKRIASDREFARLSTKTFQRHDDAFTPEDAADLRALMSIYERSRLLTVTRRYDTGAEAINRRLHRRVITAASVDYGPDFYPGEPVMMRRNDYERGLFNGDQGVVVRVSENGEPQRFRLAFARGEEFAVFSLDALRMHVELAFAMTVHKSQGSEFSEVALVLPLEAIPLATREMLYTGVTRARRAVVLVGAPALLRTAIAQRGERFSGLADKLAPAPDGAAYAEVRG
ncbi:exodeoxyribonuclease V subunit alpha [Haliangium ochraceum]|uniref:Exodeoxyribonuclease V n=1 Tax=Haliangium ochraceum (strain DSM 14365 / JCM 11303 / SMP-2) TaxID=502025 RepID=D0LWH5_HALO1|nr:exodeoxyribonuclease V subunit alpha [Haliangium ochraceum]ACY17625.1 Exodeoxyribonuclease V [Haliangium ochraceum DSM 14365]